MNASLCLLFALGGSVLAQAQNLRTLVNGPISNSISGSGASSVPVLGGQGRFVVFLSEAKNLTTNSGLEAWMDVYRHDRLSGDTILVSVNTAGAAGGNGHSSFTAVSSNGQWVAFSSFASNLVLNDTNSSEDIFLCDMSYGTTTLISADMAGNSPLNPIASGRLSTNPRMSADGRWVAFETRATNLVAVPDSPNTYDVFVRDTMSNITTAVTLSADASGTASTNCSLAGMTPDARFILFTSAATNLTATTVTGTDDHVYVRDRVLGETILASKGIPALFADATNGYRCLNPVMSEDGQFVAFVAATNGPFRSLGSSGLVAMYDRLSATTVVIASNTPAASEPQLTADGRYLAYEDSGTVYVRNLNSGETQLIGSPPSRSPVFNAKATRIAYASDPTNGPMQIYVRELASTNTWLVTSTPDGSASSSNHELKLCALNDAGNLVAFESDDSNFVSDDLNSRQDVFARDLETGQTSLISRRASERPATTPSGMSTIAKNGISADGCLILFKSHDGNLSPLDKNFREDAFVRDLSTGAIQPLGFDSAAGVWEALLSQDGRFAVLSLFAYGAQQPNIDLVRVNLATGTMLGVHSNILFGGLTRFPSIAPSVSPDGNQIAYSDLSQVYLADLSAGSNHLVSAQHIDPSLGGSERSFDPVLSPDSQWVAFASRARNLVTNAAEFPQHLYLRSLAVQRTFRIGTNPIGDSYQQQPVRTAFSADSRFIVFAAIPDSIFRYDISNATMLPVCTSCDFPSMSGDGALVAYEAFSSPTGPRKIILKNLRSGATTLISRSIHGGVGDGSSKSPVLSHDGRFVVFASTASDLVIDDNNGWADIFVYEVATGQILGIGDGPASNPVLAPDGRTLTFQSFSDRLISGDYNHTRDIFVLKLGMGDTDNDAMADDWEAAYFGNLDRNGTGDFDHDGHTDLQEYVAGTDPKNDGSTFRVLTLMSSSTGQTELFWSAIPGKTYRVEYKTDLSETDWSALPDLATATTETASAIDPNSAFGQAKFYRVVLVQ